MSSRPRATCPFSGVTGTPALFRFEAADGRKHVVAGTLRRTQELGSAVSLEFSDFQPEAAARALREGEALVAGPPSHVGPDRSLRKLVDVSPLAELSEEAQGHAPQRQRITGLARSLREQSADGWDAGGVSVGGAEPPEGKAAERTRGGPALSPARAAALKAERNALAAVLIDHVVREGLQCFEPDLRPSLRFRGLSDLSYRRLSQQYSQHLSATARALFQRLSQDAASPEEAPLRRVYQRLEQVLAQTGQRSVENFINRGFGTAMMVLDQLAPLVPRCYVRRHGAPSDSAEELGAIFRGSRRLVRQLARADIQAASLFNHGLFGPSGASARDLRRTWNAAFFELVGDGADARLELSPDAQARLGAAYNVTFDSVYEDTTGCPALVSFGEGNAVDALAEHFTRHVSALYAEQERRGLLQQVRT